jgi:hypothetical protein
MAIQVQRRRGTTAETSTFTGAIGEITIDTTKKTVVVHDGTTAGGFPLATEAAVNGKVSLTGNETIAGTKTFSSDLIANGATVGRGAGNVGSNTAVGASALAANTTGSNNVAIGNDALELNTTASNNTAIGTLALAANTTGTSNTAVGTGALDANTTAIGNTAFGVDALGSNTTGAKNTALGYQALFSNSTGQYNVAIGGGSSLAGALYGNTTGTENVAVGASALRENSTGSLNTCLGAYSGWTITSGSKNSILGNYSGNQDGLDIRTASNYVVLSDGDGNRQITMQEGKTLALDSAVPVAGTGITFPATQSASSNANTLDDYEEGTWTPVVSDASSGGNLATLNATDSTAVYTKIGNIVYWRFSVVLTSKASMTAGNVLFIQGFPFQSEAIPGNWYNPNPTIIRNITFTDYVQFHQNGNTTYGYFRENVSNATGDSILVSDLTDSAAMQASGFYRVA